MSNVIVKSERVAARGVPNPVRLGGRLQCRLTAPVQPRAFFVALNSTGHGKGAIMATVTKSDAQVQRAQSENEVVESADVQVYPDNDELIRLAKRICWHGCKNE